MIHTDEDVQRTIDIYISRTLVRPKTTWKMPVFVFLLMLLLPCGMAHVTMGIVTVHNAGLCYLVWYLVVDLLLLRVLMIQLIRCYQHYASDSLRRFCMCVPSCSEYAIEVLKKSLLPVAIYKILYRLIVTCDGEKKMDLP